MSSISLESSLMASGRTAMGTLWVFLAGTGLLLGVFWGRLPQLVPLWFSRPFGMEQLASKWALWWYLGLQLLITMTCWVIHRFAWDSVVSRTVYSWFCVLAAGLLFGSLIYVLVLVF